MPGRRTSDYPHGDSEPAKAQAQLMVKCKKCGALIPVRSMTTIVVCPCGQRIAVTNPIHQRGPRGDE